LFENPFETFFLDEATTAGFVTGNASFMSIGGPQESELTPTGSNLLDGRFAVFGYVVDNADLLGELQASRPDPAHHIPQACLAAPSAVLAQPWPSGGSLQHSSLAAHPAGLCHQPCTASFDAAT
jgi:hypothetical protein